MQNDKPTILSIQKLKHIRFSESRKSAVRAELAAFADLHAVTKPAARAVPSPFFSMRLWYGVTAFTLMILIGGSGAAFASENTLPGDVLYPMKIAVAEPVQEALATTPEGKAKLHVSFADRRLEEATQLAAQNKLDSAKQAFLAAQLDKQVTSSDQLADQLQSSGNAQTSLAVRSDLEASMTAHADLLGLIADHLEQIASSTPEKAQAARTFAMAVRSREQSVSAARLALESDVTATASSSMQSIAIATARTEHNVQDLHIQSGAHVTAIPAVVETRIQKASTALTDSKDQLGTDQVRAAARTAQDAARDSQVASIIMQHEGLLKSLGIVATTTAATTTPATSTPAQHSDEDASTTITHIFLKR